MQMLIVNDLIHHARWAGRWQVMRDDAIKRAREADLESVKSIHVRYARDWNREVVSNLKRVSELSRALRDLDKEATP